VVFPKLFLPGQTPFSGPLAAFATFFVGFAARPSGRPSSGTTATGSAQATLIATLLLMGQARSSSG